MLLGKYYLILSCLDLSHLISSCLMYTTKCATCMGGDHLYVPKILFHVCGLSLFTPVFRANASVADTRQPDGGELEDCVVISLSNLYSARQWHDLACADNDVKQFICKTPTDGTQFFVSKDIRRRKNILTHITQCIYLLWLPRAGILLRFNHQQIPFITLKNKSK